MLRSVFMAIFLLQGCLVVGTDESASFPERRSPPPARDNQDSDGGVDQVRPDPGNPPPTAVSFQELREAIFDSLCLRCHGWAADENQVQQRIRPGRPEKSRIFTMTESGAMPPRGPELTLEQLDLLRRYIMQLADLKD
jgi:hypothetical protein